MKKTLLTGALAIAVLCCINYETFAQTDWHVKGNSGTSPATNFIGTTDNKGLSIRTKSTERIRVLPSGNVGVGTPSPKQVLDVNGNINIGTGAFLFMDNHKVLRIDSAKGNIFLGNNAGDKNISSYNTATGYQALLSNTSGGYNTAIGYQALYTNSAGFYNTATGTLSL